MGFPITDRCDTAWIWTRDCSDTSCTEMQCLRPLRHSGALYSTLQYLMLLYTILHCFTMLYSTVNYFTFQLVVTNWGGQVRATHPIHLPICTYPPGWLESWVRLWVRTSVSSDSARSGRLHLLLYNSVLYCPRGVRLISLFPVFFFLNNVKVYICMRTEGGAT